MLPRSDVAVVVVAFCRTPTGDLLLLYSMLLLLEGRQYGRAFRCLMLQLLPIKSDAATVVIVIAAVVVVVVAVAVEWDRFASRRFWYWRGYERYWTFRRRSDFFDRRP